MLRVRRIIVHGLTVLSLVLSVATAIFWVRSYRVADVLACQRASCQETATGLKPDDTQYVPHIVKDAIVFNQGSLAICRIKSLFSGPFSPTNVKEWSQEYPQGTRFQWSTTASDPDRIWLNTRDVRNETIELDWLGFFIGGHDLAGLFHDSNDWHETQASVPIWFLMVISSILPGHRAVVLVTRSRRVASCRCVSCGYDLRATPDRCPECGAIPSQVNS